MTLQRSLITISSMCLALGIIMLPAAKAQTVCEIIDGLSVYGQTTNGFEYIGSISNPFDSNSIANEFGTYGSKFSGNSINNEFGTYGSKFSNVSVYNQFATKPPILVDSDNNPVGYITANTTLTPSISPGIALSCANNSFTSSTRDIPVAKETVPNSSVFSDVDSETPYFFEINKLATGTYKWIKGNPDGTFSPYKTINRAEILKMIMSSGTADAISDIHNVSCFKDIKKDQWYTRTICQLSARDMVKGYKDGTFRPNNEVTYGEALKLVITMAALTNIKEETPWYQVYFDLGDQFNIPRIDKKFDEKINKAEAAMLLYNAISNFSAIREFFGPQPPYDIDPTKLK